MFGLRLPFLVMVELCVMLCRGGTTDGKDSSGERRLLSRPGLFRRVCRLVCERPSVFLCVFVEFAIPYGDPQVTVASNVGFGSVRDKKKNLLNQHFLVRFDFFTANREKPPRSRLSFARRILRVRIDRIPFLAGSQAHKPRIVFSLHLHGMDGAAGRRRDSFSRPL